MSRDPQLLMMAETDRSPRVRDALIQNPLADPGFICTELADVRTLSDRTRDLISHPGADRDAFEGLLDRDDISQSLRRELLAEMENRGWVDSSGEEAIELICAGDVSMRRHAASRTQDPRLWGLALTDPVASVRESALRSPLALSGKLPMALATDPAADVREAAISISEDGDFLHAAVEKNTDLTSDEIDFIAENPSTRDQTLAVLANRGSNQAHAELNARRADRGEPAFVPSGRTHYALADIPTLAMSGKTSADEIVDAYTAIGELPKSKARDAALVALANHPRSSDEVKLRHFGKLSSAYHGEMAGDVRTDPRLLEAVAGATKSEDVRHLLASNLGTPETVLQNLALSTVARVRQAAMRTLDELTDARSLRAEIDLDDRVSQRALQDAEIVELAGLAEMRT